jgi:capsular exopolysaccharide synthesis family protein
MSQELPRPSSPAAELQASEGYSLDPHRQLVLTIFRWKGLILAMGLLLATAAAIAVSRQPLVWRATAKVLLKPEHLPLQVPGVGSAQNKGFSLEFLATEVEFFQSSAVLLPAARGLRVATGQASDVPEVDLVRTVDGLRQSLTVTPVPNTTVLHISYVAGSQTEAERTLRFIVEHYIEQRTVAYSGAANLTSYYEREIQQKAQDLREAEERLRQWQEENKIVTGEGQINAQVRLLSGIDASLKKASVDIEATQAQIATIKKQLAAQPQWVSPNPLREALAQELAITEARLTSLASQRDALRGQRREAEAALPTLRAKQVDFDRLSRQVEQARALHAANIQRLSDARVAAGLEGKNLSKVIVLEWPRATQGNTDREIAVVVAAGLVGMGIGFAVGFTVEFFNRSLRAPKEAELHLGLPVLTAVPELPGFHRPRRSFRRMPDNPGVLETACQMSDACRLPYERLQVWLANRNGSTRPVIMIAGCRSGAGTTTTAAGLVAALIERPAARVVGVDANLRTPSLGLVAGSKNGSGLTELLTDKSVNSEVVLRQTGRSNLFVLAAGARPRSPGSIFERSAIERLLAELRARFDFVVVDAPPLLEFPDGYALAPHVDAVLVVVDAQKTSVDDARQTVRDLERIGARPAGIVLNRQRELTLGILKGRRRAT